MDALFYYGMLAGILLCGFGYFLYTTFNAEKPSKPGGAKKSKLPKDKK